MGSDDTSFPPLAAGAPERLASFLPTLEDPSFVLGVERGGQQDKSGAIQWPWFDYGPEVLKLQELLYRDRWIVPFDWPEWQDAARALLEGEGVESADLDDLRRLLTMIFRKERFHDGFVAYAFERGYLQRIIRRAAELQDANDSATAP